jgi:glutamine cyclotransferase
MKKSTAEIVGEYGPFPGVDAVHGVTYDGERVWFAAGDRLIALDPANGKTLRAIDVAAHAGTAFDGRHLFQIAEDRIQKIDPATGRVLATIPAPGGGGDSGLTWAEGTLWVGQYRDRKIHQVDPQTGAVLRGVRHAGGRERVGTRVRWRRPVLLWRRAERKDQGRPPTQAKCRGRQPIASGAIRPWSASPQ